MATPGKRYWIGLKYEGDRYVWEDGRPYTLKPLPPPSNSEQLVQLTSEGFQLANKGAIAQPLCEYKSNIFVFL